MPINFDDLERQVDEKGSITVLDNGVTVIEERTHLNELASGLIEVQVGSEIERENEHGVMHFLEHMCYGASRDYIDRDQRKKDASKVNLSLNASTNPFLVKFPIKGNNNSGWLLNDNFPRACATIVDFAFHPLLTTKDFEREKQVILREIAEYKDANNKNLFYDINVEINKLVHKKNPSRIANPARTLGTPESVSAMTPELLREYHSRYFVGSNVKAVINHPNDSTSRSKLIEILSAIPQGVATPRHVFLPEDQFEQERVDFALPVEGSAQVHWFFRTPANYTREAQAVAALDYILSRADGSVLYEELREQRELVYSLRTTNDLRQQSSNFQISYSVNHSSLDYSIAALREVITKVGNGNFDEHLLEAYKASEIPRLLYIMQQTGHISEELEDRIDKEQGRQELTGLECARYATQITKKDVVTVAQKYLSNPGMLVVIK